MGNGLGGNVLGGNVLGGVPLPSVPAVPISIGNASSATTTGNHNHDNNGSILVVNFSLYRSSGTPEVIGLTYDGVAMGRAGRLQVGGGGQRWAEQWYLGNPTQGVRTLIPTYASVSDAVIAAVSLIDGNGDNPLVAWGGNVGNSNNPSQGVAAEDGGGAVDNITIWGFRGLSPGAGQTEWYDRYIGGGPDMEGAGSTILTTGPTQSMEYSWGGPGSSFAYMLATFR